jgi:hypothetical protein
MMCLVPAAKSSMSPFFAQCDEAWSPDFDRFELAFSRLGSSFLDRFGQKINQKFGWMRTGKSSDSLGDLC